MTRLTTWVVAILMAATLHAQDDGQNFKKYWKFRNNFRQNFIKIGPEEGESIPAIARRPTKCADNLDAVGDKGVMRWGDGMIMQGHYLGLLATEYRLLKDRGEDTRATLNELYYALNAINRSDLNAEPIITGIEDNGFPVERMTNLNGFYLRDDVPENMYEKWENAPIKCRCIESDRYFSNNAALENSGDNVARYQTTDHSIPSLDQMTSLLVGITLIDKLVEDEVYVQPQPDLPVMDIRNEAQQMANRLINYAYLHNWFLLDEWGWPVGNGGGELIFTAYPLTVIGNNLLGNDYSSVMKRQVGRYDAAQHYFSLNSDLERGIYWLTLSTLEQLQIDKFEDYNPWPLDEDGPSNFEEYQLRDNLTSRSISTDFFQVWWETLLPSAWPSFVADWEDDGKFNSTFGYPFDLLNFSFLNMADYNTTILFNLGVASGIFDSDQVAQWGVFSGNYQLILVDALLKGTDPVWGSKTFFEELLNSMPDYGGFKFAAQQWHPDPVIAATMPVQKVWSPGWGGEYKWNDPLESNSAIGHEGQFSALDYLFLHNLYYLVYGDDIEQKYEETYDCFCNDSWPAIDALPESTDVELIAKTLPQVISEEVTLHPNMKKQLALLDYCTPNTFKDFPTNELSTIYELKQLFDDYHDIGIALNEYQTETFAIQDNGQLDIESRLIICDAKTLSVNNGGIVNLLKGEILVKSGATLLVQGTVKTSPYTKIIVEDGGKIVLKNGGVLDNAGYIQLKEGAVMEYEEGTSLKMTDDRAEIHFDGGDLLIRENALFTFTKGDSQSGQLRFSKWGSHITAEGNNRFLLTGNGADDPVLVLDKNADFWCTSEDLEWTAILSAKVSLDSNARFVALHPLNVTNSTFESAGHSRGIEAFDQTTIANSTLTGLPVYAPLFFKNSGTFNMIASTFNYNSEDYMLKIRGMGYEISQTTFNGSTGYMLSAQNTTEFSSLINCTFNGDLTTVGVIDNSATELTANNCEFNTLYAGIHKMDGKLNLRCNAFNQFRYAGVVAHNNCLLDMSTDGLGGHNSFIKNSADFGKNVALWNAQNVNLSEGFNYFDDQGALAIIDGTVQLAEPSPNIPSEANQWNSLNVIPPVSDFSVTSSITGENVNFITDAPESSSCPVDGGSGPIGDAGSFFLVQGNEMAMINTVNFQNIPLTEALDDCIELTKRYNDVNSDLIALQRFEEVLTTYPQMPQNTLTDRLVYYGVQQMKNTLGYAFKTGEITREANTAQFHQGVQSYVHVLNVLTNRTMNVENYNQLFHLEMNKAHLYNLLGKPATALQFLLNAESCGLDSAEQAHLNFWKYEWDETIRKMAYGFQAEQLDTNWVDTILYNIPVSQQFGNFGSQITSLNSIDFFNCSNPRMPITENNTEILSSDFSVYPNPNSGTFQLEYSMPEHSQGLIIVSNLEGKEISRFTCPKGNQTKQVSLSGLERGTYLYSFYVDTILTKTGKIIVK